MDELTEPVFGWQKESFLPDGWIVTSISDAPSSFYTNPNIKHIKIIDISPV